MIHLNPCSRNKKTGPIPVSTSSENTCPDVCPFKGRGCYAKYGPLMLHWRKVTEKARGDNWKDFLRKIKDLPDGILWRHNQAGDLAGANNQINVEALKELTKANKGKRGFTYTHKPVLDSQGVPGQLVKENRKAIKEANDNGFAVNLSGNNPRHADELVKLGIAPVTTVVPIEQTRNFETEGGNKVVICPAIKSERMNCAKCKLCAMRDRSFIIGFPAHGTAAKTVSKIAS